MGKDFWIIIDDPERAQEFLKVFGRVRLNIKSPIPRHVNLPGKGTRKIYELDLSLISDEERERLAAHLSERFNMPVKTILADLDRIGMPILADGCTVVIENPQRWMM